MAKLGNIREQVKGRIVTQDSRSVDISIRDIPIGDIEIRRNIRQEYTDIEGLKESIQQHGLLQPITVYREDDTYIVKTGHRRYKAFQLLSKEEPDIFHSIRCIVSNADNVAVIQLVENVQRVELSQRELYEALSTLREQRLTLKQIAELMGKSEGYIKNLFIGINEISRDQNLKELISHAGVTIQDIVETKGVAGDQKRLDLLNARKSGEINRDELRKKAKECKENHAGVSPENDFGDSHASVTSPDDFERNDAGIILDFPLAEADKAKPDKPEIFLTFVPGKKQIHIEMADPDNYTAFDSLVNDIKQFFLTLHGEYVCIELGV
jgi:ParB family chromosome partitioning protein